MGLTTRQSYCKYLNSQHRQIKNKQQNNSNSESNKYSAGSEGKQRF